MIFYILVLYFFVIFWELLGIRIVISIDRKGERWFLGGMEEENNEFLRVGLLILGFRGCFRDFND